MTKILLAALVGIASLAAPAAAGTDRTRAFVSDTHFGVGRTADGRWHAMEDARWAEEWKAFLAVLDAHGTGRTDLVLNGDTFELWQSVTSRCDARSPDLGCTEDEALSRIERALGQHARELAALREFAVARDNRVVLVPGNHDAALCLPAVRRAVLAAIAAPPDRVTVAEQGFWLSPDGLVYAEHGHQIGQEVNRFGHWPCPTVERDGTRYLERPWGEQFVQEFYNRYEERYPIIDNLSDEGTGVRYGLAAEGLAGTAAGVADFLRFYLLDVSWAQFVSALGPGEEPAWDLETIRRRPDADRFIVESFATDDPLRAGAERALAEGKLAVRAADLTDDELRLVCDRRAALLRAQQHAGRPPTITACALKSLGAASQQLFGTYQRHLGQYLVDTYRALRTAGKTAAPFRIFVFGHTHLADPGFRPLAARDPEWNPLVVNTGAWQRTVTPERLAALAAARGITESALLTTLRPEDLPACYAVVLVPPYADTPRAHLRWWRTDVGAVSKLAGSCD